MSEGKRKKTGQDEPTWVEIAQTSGGLEAEIIRGLLTAAEIPVFVESVHGIAAIFGQMGNPCRVYVPEQFYDEALDLIEDEEPPYDSLDEPSIKL